MSTLWKVLLGLALVLPVGAYVAGSLVASATSDEPARRAPIVIRDVPHPGVTLAPSPTPETAPGDDSGDGSGIPVVPPRPDDLDGDDDDRDDDGRDDRDDDRDDDDPGDGADD